MTVTFRPAIRKKVPLLIGLIGSTGSGKTLSAFKLAHGMSGGKPFAVIDTEGGRALHYAPSPGEKVDPSRNLFDFAHADLPPPFRPMAYADAIHAADQGDFPVVVIDSCSHEHAGEGGILDWQEEELTRMAGDDWKKRESCKMASWIKPKMAHKQMVQRLLQVRAHLILCFRAEERTKVYNPFKEALMAWQHMPGGDAPEPKPSDTLPNKMVIEPIGWQPICEKNLPYELTVSLLLTPDAPGVPKPLKLNAAHRPLFPAGQQINEESGKRLAAWATGGSEIPAPTPCISEEQQATLIEECQTAGIPIDELKKVAKVEKLGEILAERYEGARKWIAGRAK